MMSAYPGDTIVAISTAIGPGAIAVVRMSGERAIAIADAVFRGRTSLADAPTQTAHYGTIVDAAGAVVDEVLLTLIRSPKSYTTEDMVEIGCHGGPVPARRVLDACLDAGARPARSGEFTERAFVAGRIDLVQAEAVADIVGARTRRGLEAALGQLEGGLSSALLDLRERVLDARADVEALVDFPEEEIAVEERSVVRRKIGDARSKVDELLRNCEYGLAVREGVSVALVGKPNVGKSSLMNALLKRDRSIVTGEPGTTRDAIEEELHIDGVPIRLIDTAGWRDPGDEAERQGVGRARAAARGASLSLLVVSGFDGLDEADASIAADLDPCRVLVVVNKTDVEPAIGDDEIDRFIVRWGNAGARAVRVSALTGDGLPRLRSAIAEAALGEAAGDEPPLVTNARHRDALLGAGEALDRAAGAWAGGTEPELVAVELMEASSAVGEIIGETTPEDVLARIFERFCVGK